METLREFCIGWAIALVAGIFIGASLMAYLRVRRDIRRMIGGRTFQSTGNDPAPGKAALGDDFFDTSFR